MPKDKHLEKLGSKYHQSLFELLGSERYLKLKQLAKPALKFRRRIFELLGSRRYSMPAINGIDRKLETYIPSQGFFIEVGANDGFSESNTYYLEKFKGWRGILIEPIPELYQKCIKERPNSKVFSCALVAHDYPEKTVEMSYGHLMSLVKGSFKTQKAESKHLALASKFFQVTPYELQVPARTLTSILDECNVNEVDFFSLDVEGFELNVLKGLDFEKYRPKYMLIECFDEQAKEKIESYLSNFYICIEQLSKYNFLFEIRL